MKLKVEYFKDFNGHSPAKDFIDNLSGKARAKTLRTLFLLSDFGLDIGMPYLKPFTGVKGVWELRVRTNNNIYRYFFIIDKSTAVILHGFQKKSQKTPNKEINFFKKRLGEHNEKKHNTRGT